MQRVLPTVIVLLGTTMAATSFAAGQPASDLVARGHYLALAGDCVACHTAPGGTPYAGGRKIETPFGVLVGSNLTPDKNTGIGNWTDDQFVRAVQEGIGHNGEHLYPAMPYTAFTNVSRDDVLAIRAYLQTLAPVHNPVQANQLPFPFDIRASLIGWNMLFFNHSAFQADTSKSSEWNRGAYLVDGLGHCSTCHTAKNMLGGDKGGQFLQGGVVQGWNAPGLDANIQRGIGSWSVDDIIEYLKTGRNDYASASGPMAEAVSFSTSHMNDGDLRAIAVYLKDLPPQTAAPIHPDSSTTLAIQAGLAIYTDNCESCHTRSGMGVPHIFPALKGSPQVQASDPATLTRVILQGAQSVATDIAPTASAMPAFGWKLTDRQIADVATYIRNSWGNAAAPISVTDVHSARTQLHAEAYGP
jgi:mono/diheme cytochrome c family protein